MKMSSSGIISSNSSYKNDGLGGMEVDYSTDPASGGFFQSNYKKHDDLKEMLDTNKDGLKLEAMKRIIGMIAKGKDASDLFPAVVKNVVSKNIELKKLVYVYLVRYAEEQQDLALLSISTFQRALKEPNQLIRAGALRVLSSIRVSMIVPIVILAIRDAASDMSPYVRKTAAHAIPKLYSLDPEQKPELIAIIQKLLADRTVLVVGSAVMAYNEVCPDKVELIHQVFRKLCALLVDVDEWGQVVIVNMLTRYARTQFGDPNANGRNGNLQTQQKGSDSDSSNKSMSPVLDPDHRLLLRSARPLLQSRNSAVVMSVAQLYHHCAPKSEAPISARALVRLLHSHTEVQCMVLDNIASISAQSRGTFEPYLKSFFIRTSDPTRIKLLKLDILTHLVTESNVSIILRELQTYIPSNDKQFVAATIQAIGRCACSISEITDLCLSGLVSLMSNKNEAVVAESVIVIKRLLQTRSGNSQDIIIHMNRLLDNITVAQARAAILWLLGEHLDHVKLIAPDVLRKLSKSFPDEDDVVKLQILNLSVKLYIKNPGETNLLTQYIFNLARYDQNFDIRDRARLLKNFTQNSNSRLFQQASRIFLSAKPAPMLESQFSGRDQFQLGSLSHYINAHAANYEPLPPFPEHPPPSKTRDVEPPFLPQEKTLEKGTKKPTIKPAAKNYGTSSSEDSDSSSQSSSESETHSDEVDETKGQQKDNKDSSSSGSTSESEEDTKNGKTSNLSEQLPTEKKSSKPVSNIDLLLDLNLGDSNISLGQYLTPLQEDTTKKIQCSTVDVVFPSTTFTKNIELLNRITGNGLSITYRYTRTPHLYSSSMVSIGLTFTNTGHDDITNIHLGKRGAFSESNIHPFVPIATLNPNCSLSGTIGVHFNDSTNPANLEIVSSKGACLLHIIPSVGELMRPIVITEECFNNERSRLKGMNEHSTIIPVCSDSFSKVFQVANVSLCQSPNPDIIRFTGQTLSSSTLVLITLQTTELRINVTVNCDKIVIGSLLLSELKCALK